MKKSILLTLLCFVVIISNAQLTKDVTITAGGLSGALTINEKTTITNLQVRGYIDARDFKTMRDSMPLLERLDLSNVEIDPYNGNEGTSIMYGTNYPAYTIPEFAFIDQNWVGKTNLVAIVLPNSLKIIGRGAFLGCTGLRSVSIPSAVVSISNEAFFHCEGLDSVTIPSSVNYIGDYSFSSCYRLKSVTILSSSPPDMSSSIDVFTGVDLTGCTLYVPYRTTATYRAKTNWNNFKNIIEMQGLYTSTSLVNFSPNAGSKKIYIASSEKWTANSSENWLTIHPAIGESNDSLTLTVTENTEGKRTAKIMLYTAGIDSQTITVDQYGGIEVTAGQLSKIIGNDAPFITSLTLYGSIDARDFKTMRDSIPNLQKIDLSNVSVYAYSGTEGTNNYTDYPADVIPDLAFYNKKKLITIILPTNITYIDKNAFQFCDKLKNISIPPFVTVIGSNAFEYCSGLETVVIPSSVISIDPNAFSWCTKLTNIAIPSSVTTIGSSAFWCCTSLPEIEVPASVNSIELYAFGRCSALINVDANNPLYSSIEGVLYNKTQTKLIQCPISKTGKFKIPSSVTSINESAFVGCASLTSISIPDSIISIGNYAFSDCKGLTSIIVFWNKPLDLSSSFNVFENVNVSTCILYVPTGKVNVYRNTTKWKDFKTISEWVSSTDISGADNLFEVYPNPTNGNCMVVFTNLTQNKEIYIYNSSGIKIYSTTIKQPTHNVNISNFKKGIYFIKVITNSESSTKKLLVN
jgi:hypothetical protein